VFESRIPSFCTICPSFTSSLLVFFSTIVDASIHMRIVSLPSIVIRLASVAVASGFVNLERSTFITKSSMVRKASAEASIEKQLREVFPDSNDVVFTGGGSVRVDDVELYFKVLSDSTTSSSFGH